MPTPKLEDKIIDGIKKHSKDIANNAGNIGVEAIHAGQSVAKNIINKDIMHTGKAIGSGVYNITKATVGTGIAVTKSAVSAVTFPYRRRRSFRDYFWHAKDGMIAGSADNDPASIVTYTQVGVSTGLSQIWLLFISTPMLIAVEEMAARIGLVTKKGFNEIIREQFGKGWAYFLAILLIVCNIAVIGADMAGLSAVIGLITGISWQIFLIPIAILFYLLLVRNKEASIGRFLFIITPIFLLYIITAIIIKPDWIHVLNNVFLPSFDNNLYYWMSALGLMGTTISPFILYWETKEEVASQRTAMDIKKENKSITIGMVYSNMAALFMIICGAMVIQKTGIVSIENADQAALALKPLAGHFATILFALGILGAGLISIPILTTTTSYVVSETMGWKHGLNYKLKNAKGFYFVIFSALLFGAILGLIDLKPMIMLFYSQIFQGIISPILIIFLMLICNNKNIMGEYTNKKWTNFWSILAIIFMLGAAGIMFWDILIKFVL